MNKASIEQDEGTVMVHANSPRPLEQALDAICQAYGWLVDFEDPPYESVYDLIDDTDPNWRESHPRTKGVTRVAGGKFTAQFLKPGNAEARGLAEMRILNQVVYEYQLSGNPGHFAVKQEGAERYAIVGVGVRNSAGEDKAVPPLLDTPVTLMKQSRTVLDTVKLVLRQVSASRRVQIIFATAPMALLIHTKTEIGGTNISARELLSTSLTATKKPLVWRLLYDADYHAYFLNLVVNNDE
jgi:hypothetical protein